MKGDGINGAGGGIFAQRIHEARQIKKANDAGEEGVETPKVVEQKAPTNDRAAKKLISEGGSGNHQTPGTKPGNLMLTRLRLAKKKKARESDLLEAIEMAAQAAKERELSDAEVEAAKAAFQKLHERAAARRSDNRVRSNANQIEGREFYDQQIDQYTEFYNYLINENPPHRPE